MSRVTNTEKKEIARKSLTRVQDNALTVGELREFLRTCPAEYLLGVAGKHGDFVPMTKDSFKRKHGNFLPEYDKRFMLRSLDMTYIDVTTPEVK